MRHKVLALFTVSAVALMLVGGDHYLEMRTTKIDDMVSLVTLDEHVIVMQRGVTPRVTRVRPAVTPSKFVNVTPPSDVRPKPAPATIKWTLPYSCADVRYYNSRFTPAQLEAMRKVAGIPMPTTEQRVQIQACLAGRVK